MNKLMIPTIIGATFAAGMAVVPSVYADAEVNCDALTDTGDPTTNATNLKTCLDKGSVTLGNNANITVTGDVIVIDQKDATLNLGTNGTITKEEAANGNLFEVKYVGLNITGNGTIETKKITTEGNQIVTVLFKGDNGKHLDIGQGVTLKGQVPLYFSSKTNNPSSSTVDISGTIWGTSSNDAAIFAPHNLEKGHGITVTLHSSAEVKNPTGGPAASLGGYTDFTSDGALIEGGTGIGIGDGKLTLKGNTRIHANGTTEVEFDHVNNTLPTYGAAIQVVHAMNFGEDSDMNFDGNVEIIIEDGEYTSANGSPIADLYDKEKDTTTSGIKDIQISGGKFTSKAGEPLVKSTDDEFNRTGFISGGTFLSGDEKMEMPANYLASGYTEDSEGNVITENSGRHPTSSNGSSNNGQTNEKPNDQTPSPAPNESDTPSTKPADDGPQNPNTADPIALYAGLAAAALLGLSATALSAKKARR